MGKVVIILDYNNIFTSDTCTPEEIECTLSTVVQEALAHFSGITECYIRIYGGWYQNGILTGRGSEIMQKFSSICPIPDVFAGRSVLGNVTFVEQIYGVEHSWLNTYREKPGPRLIPRRDVHRAHCVGKKNECPVELLSKFTKKENKVCHIEGCNTVYRDVFSQYGQKMVDTMMVCDILTYGEDEDTLAIYVLTDDVDLYPSLALCRCKFPEIYLSIGIRNQYSQPERELLCNSFGINCISL